MTEVTLRTTGMMCGACEMLIETTLSDIDGVAKVEADYSKETTTVTFDENLVDVERLVKAIKGAGYEAQVLNAK